MATNEIHVDDIGTTLQCTINDNGTPVDVSDATTRQIILDRPGTNSKSSYDADFTTDGTDGKIQYVTQVDDVAVAGDWHLQGKVITPSGTWYSDIIAFKVHGNL